MNFVGPWMANISKFFIKCKSSMYEVQWKSCLNAYYTQERIKYTVLMHMCKNIAYINKHIERDRRSGCKRSHVVTDIITH